MHKHLPKKENINANYSPVFFYVRDFFMLKSKSKHIKIRIFLENGVKFMNQQKLNRISELTRISRTRELTEEEQAERQALRNEYRQSVIGNLTAQLESTTIVEPDGTKIKVKDRKKEGDKK